MEIVLRENFTPWIAYVSTQTTGSGTLLARSDNFSIWPNLSATKNPGPILKLLQRLELSNPEIKSQSVHVEIGIALTGSYESLTSLSQNGFMRVHDVKQPGILELLSGIFKERFQLKLELTDVANGKYTASTVLNASGVVSRISTMKYGIETKNMDFQNDLYQLHRTRSDRFWATMKLIAVVSEDIFPNIESFTDDKFYVTKAMLIDEIECDLTIVSGNGVNVKCHKSVLAVHSPVFQTMFQSSMRESKTNTVEIPDMTEEAVRALLAYLYYWDTTQAMDNSSICFELFHAAHKYDIRLLDAPMKKILLAKEIKWFDVDVSMRLFLFARNLPDGEQLKMKAIQVLKPNYSTLKESESYQQLFKKDQKAAMELCEYAFSI